MAEWWETGLDWILDNADTLIQGGFSVADYVTKEDVPDNLRAVSETGYIAPFSVANREAMGQKYMEFQNDPEKYMANLPGYQYGLDQTRKEVNREAARTGHYLGTKRMEDMSANVANYVDKNYGAMHDRLAEGAGVTMQPDARAYADLQTSAIGAEVGQTKNLLDTVTNEGDSGLFDLAKDAWEKISEATGADEWFSGLGESLGIDFEGWGADAQAWAAETFDIDLGGMSDSFKGFVDDYGLNDIDFMSAGKRILQGEDPKEVIKDTAIDYMKDQGKEYLTDKAKEFFNKSEIMDIDSGGLQDIGGDAGLDSGYGDAMNLDVGGAGPPGSQSWGADGLYDIAGTGMDAPAGMGDLEAGMNFSDAGADSLYGDAPGPSTPSAPVDPTMIQSGAVMGGAAIGGYVGGELADRYVNPHLGEFGKTPIAKLGSQYGGALGGAALGGYATGYGTAAAGTGAAAGAGVGAVAGPLAIAAVAYMVGSGAYGMYKGSQAKEEARDAYKTTVGEIWGGDRIDDPTGLGLGRGVMHTTDGFNFYLPEEHYTSINQKNLTGQYEGVFGSGSAQGSYGYYQDPESGMWQEGRFGGDREGADSFSAGSWSFLDEGTIASANEQNRAKIDQYLVDSGRADEASTWDPTNAPLTPEQRWSAQYGEGSHEYTAGGVRQQRTQPEYMTQAGNRA